MCALYLIVRACTAAVRAGRTGHEAGHMCTMYMYVKRKVVDRLPKRRSVGLPETKYFFSIFARSLFP